jgi:hypothetical protein
MTLHKKAQSRTEQKLPKKVIKTVHKVDLEVNYIIKIFLKQIRKESSEVIKKLDEKLKQINEQIDQFQQKNE